MRLHANMHVTMSKLCRQTCKKHAILAALLCSAGSTSSCAVAAKCNIITCYQHGVCYCAGRVSRWLPHASGQAAEADASAHAGPAGSASHASAMHRASNYINKLKKQRASHRAGNMSMSAPGMLLGVSGGQGGA